MEGFHFLVGTYVRRPVGVFKVLRICHCDPLFGEAISKWGMKIASTGTDRWFCTCACGTGAGNEKE
jgi:hypothetical protein